jgi:hydroxymethylpyrimidine pyrophosphatase-like HAD family hydrolase
MRFPKIRIIFQDVDGCLNPADGEDFGVTPEWEATPTQIRMLHAIDKAVDESTIEHFIINTGRFWPILENIVKHFSSPKIRYFVMEHACVIHDRHAGTNLDLAATAKACELHDLASRYTSLDTMQILLKWYDDHGQKLMEDTYGSSMPRLDKIGNLSFAFPPGSAGEEVLSVIEAAVKAGLSDADFRRLDFCCSDRFVDILPGIHKMDGIELMCAHLGIDQAEALAVGDYLNDLAVFEAFPQVMCPSNAHPRIIGLTAEKQGDGYVSKHPYGESLIDLLGKLSSRNS